MRFDWKIKVYLETESNDCIVIGITRAQLKNPGPGATVTRVQISGK
jgi:hypothetical protein